MRTAIVDNSTLTSVQRLLGDIEIKNKHTLDGDILCFELLIQSILFYDNLYYLNDYKDSYRKQRAEFFPYLTGIEIDEEDQNKISTATAQICTDIIPEVRDQQIADDNFKPFFELLKMNNIYTWDMSSSIFYLTQKMLNNGKNEIDIPKYSKLNEMIFNELSDSSNRPNFKGAVIFDSNGKNILDNFKLYNKEGVEVEKTISKQTDLYFANLNWLAYRSIYYTILTKELGGGLILNPIRSSFQLNYLSGSDIQNKDIYRNIIDSLNRPTEDTLKAIYNTSKPIVNKYNLPMFSVWLVNQTKDITQAINLALEMRHYPEFIQARERLSGIELLFEKENSAKALKEANKIRLGILENIERLCAKYYVSVPQGIAVSPLITVYNLGVTLSGTQWAKIPALPGKVKSLDKIKDFIPQKGFNCVYKSLVQDLTQIGKLGEYHNLLTSQVKYHRDADYYSIKQENSNFRYSKSYWKIPL